MNAKSIAVVIPMLNGEAWIHSTLSSVLAQTVAPREIVVVDNGSVDQSIEIASSFPEVTVLSQYRKGTHHARQSGLEKTTSEQVTFLDQDDILHPRHLEILSSLLDHHPGTSAAVSRTLTFQHDHDLHFSRPGIKAKPFDPWDTFPFNRIDTPSMVLIRRDALEAIGGWPTENGWSSDVQAWFQLSSISPMVMNSSATAAYRTHHKQATSYQWRQTMAYEYLSEVNATCESVAQERMKTHPTEAEKRQRQHRILKPMCSFIEAFSSLDSGLAQSALVQIEHALASRERPERMIARALAIDTLLWYVRPSIESDDAQQVRLLIQTLCQHTSPEIKSFGTRIIFRLANEISRSMPIRYLLSKPLEPGLWVSLLRYQAYPSIAKRFNNLGRILSGSPSLLGECRKQTGIQPNEKPVL